MGETETLPSCLNCGARFEAARVSAKRRFAKCSHCGALHNIAALFPDRPLASDIAPALPVGLAYREGRTHATVEFLPLGWTSQGDRLLVRATFGALVVLAPGLLLTSMLDLWVGLIGVFVAILGLVAVYTVYLFRSGWRTPEPASVVQVWRGGVRFQTGTGTEAFAGHVPLESLRGFVGVSRGRWFRVKVLAEGQGHMVAVPEVFDEETCRVALHLLEHAVRRAKRSGDATAPPAPSADHIGLRRSGSRAAAYAKADAPVKGPVRRLQCSGCGAPIALAGINREERLGTCRYCGLVQDVSQFLRVPRPPERKLVLPRRTHVQREPGRITLGQLLDAPVRHGSRWLITATVLTAIGAAAFLAAAVMGHSAYFVGFLILAGLSAYTSLKWDRTTITMESVTCTLDHQGVRRLPGFPRDPDAFTVELSEVGTFIPQAYTEGDTLRYSVAVEALDGTRYTLLAGLEYEGSAFVLAEQLTELYTQLSL